MSDLNNYLKRMAKQHDTRFLRYDGVIYEVTWTTYPTGPSPLWSIEEVRPVDVPTLQEEQS